MGLEPPVNLRSALADRYAIERELGRGGNAVVYLACDLKHDRPVALKVLNPELALAVRTERFFREIQIAAKLSHPHILTLIDSGKAGRGEGGTEFLYYVMPYVEGESLRERLKRDKLLPLEDALAITKEVAGALGYAHSQGVVHRDIKPENILLHGGHAVVMDFGIARALTVAGGDGITEGGLAVGTPAYMAPEQGAGSGEPDARSDIYSLGCVLYEMLAGHPPFTGSTAQEVLSRHALDPVPSLRAARAAVPEALERAVARALAKQPLDRFPRTGDFVAELANSGVAAVSTPAAKSRRFVPVAVGLALVLGAWLAVRLGWLGPANAGAQERAVAVLPCSGLSTDPEIVYLSEWIAEELITALNKVPGLRVPGRSSSFSVEGPNKVRAAARSLGVSHAVECTVRQAGGQLSIGVRLVDAEGNQLWAQPFRGSAADPFGLQEQVAQAVVAQLQDALPLGASPAVLVRRSTENQEALELYQRGRYFFNRRTPDGVRKALADFEAAARLDAGFALAYSGLSDVYGYSGAGRNIVPVSRDSAYRLTKTYALKAVDLDSTLAEAWTSLGRARYIYDWDFVGAEDAFRKAVRLDDKYAFGHQRYGLFLSWVMSPVGRCPDAIREARRARELDPLLATTNTVLGNAMRFCGRYDEAIEYYRRSIQLESGIGEAHAYLAHALVKKGMLSEALVYLDTAEALGTQNRALRAFIYARTGRVDDAAGIVETLKQEQAQGQLRSQSIAVVYLGMGDRDRAFEELGRAVERRDFPAGPSLGGIFSELKSDPRYDALLRKAGLKR
jgi:serine/threonine-protein kinase